MSPNKPTGRIEQRSLAGRKFAPRETEEGLAGYLVIDKPEGLSSMSAVSAVRRRAGGMKCGHAGTLDPLATGVLVVGIGRTATKHLGSIMNGDKEYETEIDLRCFTTTDDREGERINCVITNRPNEEAIREAAQQFLGVHLQAPPTFSAVKVDGKRAYRHARQGSAVEPPPREVRCDAIEVLSYEWPLIRMRVRCGKGFYIRSLARDFGRALGTGGHCSSIRRTVAAPFSLEEATPLDGLPDHLTQSDLLSVEATVARLDETGAE